MQGSRAVHRWTAVAAALLLLPSCGSAEEPIAAEDAVVHYDEVAAAVSSAASPEDVWTLADTTRHVDAEGAGGCLYTPGDWSIDGPLISPGGRSWDEVIAALGPVLAEAGFEPVESTTEQQSRRILETTDGHGATLRLTEDGTLRIHSAQVEADSCTDAALGIT